MTLLAIIGGTGLSEFPELTLKARHPVFKTVLGYTSGDILEAQLGDQRLLFLPRHGHPHALPPHKINYRANLLALQQLGATSIVSINAVGAINDDMMAGQLIVPDQIIDYTWGRESTFFDGDYRALDYIDFSYPYDKILRQKLLSALDRAALPLGYHLGATYGATQGPRLETCAEISRLERDGCDIVGMTGMPEAALARELEIPYISLCLVVNAAAGKTDAVIELCDIQRILVSGMDDVKRVIQCLCHSDLSDTD